MRLSFPPEWSPLQSAVFGLWESYSLRDFKHTQNRHTSLHLQPSHPNVPDLRSYAELWLAKTQMEEMIEKKECLPKGPCSLSLIHKLSPSYEPLSTSCVCGSASNPMVKAENSPPSRCAPRLGGWTLVPLYDGVNCVEMLPVFGPRRLPP